MIYQAMSREEADKIVEWAEDQLTVSMTVWQKELFAVILMHPDAGFTVSYGRY
jgi:hypothetical protein